MYVYIYRSENVNIDFNSPVREQNVFFLYKKNIA